MKKSRTLLQQALAGLILIAIAIAFRVSYQNHNQTSSLELTRGDQGKYLRMTHNLAEYGVFSLDIEDPESIGTDIKPGYPIFLKLFTKSEGNINTQSALVAQLIIGSLTAVFTFFTALIFLPLIPSLIIGFVTALNPHLISLENYFLTETLFTFFMSLGVYLFSLGNYMKKLTLITLGTILLGLSAEIRAINILVVPIIILLSGLQIIDKKNKKVKDFKKKQFGLTICAAIFLLIGNIIFVEANTPRLPENRFSEIKSPKRYLSNFLTPTNQFVEGTTLYTAQNLTSEKTKQLKQRTPLPFSVIPTKYIQWLSYGKTANLWDNKHAYTGTVHVYPKSKESDPFQNGKALQISYEFNKILHWPLFLLTILGLFIYLYKLSNKQLNEKEKSIALVPLVFAYQFITLQFISWIARYTMPLRPLSYVLAGYAIVEIYNYFNAKKKQLKH